MQEKPHKNIVNLKNPAAVAAYAKGDLANAIIASTPDGIERQEAVGQRSFVKSDVLPRRCNGCTREQLESFGIVFGDDVDDLFVNVRLPQGWMKAATNHSMWSHLVDEKGRVRARVFYKAAFYDQQAEISLLTRFSCSCRPVGGWKAKEPYRFEGYVTDCDADIFVTAATEPEPPYGQVNPYTWRDWEKTKDAKQSEAEAWLLEHYPDYRNPLAYWDEP